MPSIDTAMFATLATHLRRLRQRRRVAREMDDELRFHVEMETQANIARGWSPADARRRALCDLGGVEQTKEAIRDVRTIGLDSWWQDIRDAGRHLRRGPGMTLAAISMLGLAIGLTTAMFTLVDTLILRPSPFHDPDHLASLFMGNERGGRLTVAPAVLRAWRESPAFAGAESAVADTGVVDVDGAVATRGTARVTPGIFTLLGGIRPIRGRLFDASDTVAGTSDRVLLSEDVWRGLYHADPGIIGRLISLNGERLMAVGVLPSDFHFPTWNTVFWRAVDVDASAATAADRRAMAYVRFAPHVPRADALRMAAAAARDVDGTTAALLPQVQPLAGLARDDYSRRAVPLLAGGVILVFLVLCANVSSLLLARLTARQREFSMRSALGASRARLMRQAFVENSAIGLLSIVAGTGIAWALVSLCRAFLPDAFLLRTLNPLNLDLRALAVTSGSGIIATIGAGLLPAWMGTRMDAGDSLRVTERSGTETPGARALTRGLLMGEFAFACTLLVVSLLLVRSFLNLAHTKRGLTTDGVLVARMAWPTPAPHGTPPATAARAIEEQLEHLPGVQQLAWSYGVPPDGGALSVGLWQSDAADTPVVNLMVERYKVGPEFFTFYGITLLRGRTFTQWPSAGEVVVGERLAGDLWPGLDPIGRRFSFEREHFQVVGVAKEIHHPSLDTRLDRPEFYEPFDGIRNDAALSLRCGARCPNPGTIRQRIAAAQPTIQVSDVRMLDDVYYEQLARPRAAAALGVAFAGVAILAAAGGLFSVLSFAVSRRTHEFGIRTALGASPLQIQRVVLRDGLRVAVTGLGMGVGAAIVLARALSSLEYHVTIADPLMWLLVLALLALTTVAASWRPARQAMHVDPVRLLQRE